MLHQAHLLLKSGSLQSVALVKLHKISYLPITVQSKYMLYVKHGGVVLTFMLSFVTPRHLVFHADIASNTTKIN